MDNKKEALQELLELIVKYPWLADRIIITIKPNKVLQDNSKAE